MGSRQSIVGYHRLVYPRSKQRNAYLTKVRNTDTSAQNPKQPKTIASVAYSRGQWASEVGRLTFRVYGSGLQGIDIIDLLDTCSAQFRLRFPNACHKATNRNAIDFDRHLLIFPGRLEAMNLF